MFLLYALTFGLAAAGYDKNLLRIVHLDGKQGKECGKDETAHKFDTVDMHYTGWVAKGPNLDEKSEKSFDSSRTRDQEFNVQLGKGNVIKGWDFGILGMCLGSQRRLLISPEYGY